MRPKDRLDTIDVLRGLALFGVLTVNLVTEFRVSIFQQFLPLDPASLSNDLVTEAFVHLFLESKAFSLFSLLFGIGLAIQFERLAGTGSRLRLLVRRLIVLLAIGLIHLCLVWNGDILTEYALIGLVAVPLLYLPNRVLTLVGVLLLAIYVALPWLLPSDFWPTQAWIQQHVAEASRTYANGGYRDFLSFSVREIPSLLPLHVYVSARTLALFLVGVLAWRSGILCQPGQHRRTLIGLTIAGLSLGAILTAFEGTGPYSVFSELGRFVSPLTPLGPVTLAIGYGGAVVSLVAFTRARQALHIFAPLGRMAFTNYLLQSLIFGWIFFGYGGGYFGQLGATHTLMLGIAVYAAQLAASAWWLSRYRFGPIEWLWRTLMYGVRQPMVLARI